MTQKELNSRQWALYNLLRDNPDRFFKQSEISERIPEYEATEDGAFHDSAARLQMTRDIRALNDSPIIQKIIISTTNGIKIANKEEFQTYISREYASIFRRLKRTRRKAQKGGLDGQLRFTFGREREEIQAFSDSINRLKAARLAKGLTLSDVVKAVSEKGFDVPLLSKMEHGLCDPTPHQKEKLFALYELN